MSSTRQNHRVIYLGDNKENVIVKENKDERCSVCERWHKIQSIENSDNFCERCFMLYKSGKKKKRIY